MRLGDFVNESIIRRILDAVGRICSFARDQYVSVQDDSPEEWSVSGTLAYLGLGNLGVGKAKPRVVDGETAKAEFAAL